jgi:sialate O-acetylesterase
LKKWTDQAASLQTAGLPIPPKPLPTGQPKMPLPPDGDLNLPTVLYNGMVAPIVPYAIKGVIWYQGESNAGQAKLYQTLFPTLITDWRTRWTSASSVESGEGDFPFIWAQICNSMAPVTTPVQTSTGYPGLREAQSMTLKLPNTAQAVTIDIGDGNNVHPRDKQDVAHRMALAARHLAYGEDLLYSGPTYDSMQIAGDKIRLTFKNVGSGLTIASAPSTQPGVPQGAPASELKGFSIAGTDHKFVWATATIEPPTPSTGSGQAGSGQAADSVVVSSPAVPNPVAVRYAWANNPEENLYNKEGLPASPFRTDGW